VNFGESRKYEVGKIKENKMKVARWLTLILVMLLIADLKPVLCAALPMRIADDVQIVPDGLQAALKAKGLEYADSAWPKELGRNKVDEDQIPGTVLAKTTNWIRVMIKNEYLPKEPNEWLVGIRKAMGEYTADCLVMRYSVGPHKVQIQEYPGTVRLLIDVNDPNLWKTRVEDFLAATVSKFLNYPVDKLSKLTFKLNKFAHESQTIYYGTMDCDFDFESKEAWEKRVWWNHTYVWTDGKRAYFSLVEMDGKPVEGTQARPGFPRRFR
jgi:hypothetical protein